jgi:hypothetical protein
MGEMVAARDSLTVFQLPPYASELNPVESVWSQPDLIDGFLTGTRLDLTGLGNPRN